MAILEEMHSGMKKKTPEIILDRKEAITRACLLAKATPHSTVLITGKGTDPFIMGKNGTKTSWDDRAVARAVLSEIGYGGA
jgi:UDP-N-acetylmuramyl tripeptide synthase